MATLAVRSLRIRDLAQLRSVNEVVDRLDSPLCRFRLAPGLMTKVVAIVPGRGQGERAFVATIDGELCAYLVAHREQRSFQWELAEIAAGSPRLEATYPVSVELWTALIAYAVRQAGSLGVKRVHASAQDDSPAFESLRANGFEPYEERFILSRKGKWHGAQVRLSGVRPQLDSDVWSIHQLYHQVTPRAVQFAEALTSAEWEGRPGSWFNRAVMGTTQEYSFVLDTGDGVSGYCRIVRKSGCAMVRLMMVPEFADSVSAFLYTCVSGAGVGDSDRLEIDVPGYCLEYLGALEHAGFVVSWERCGLVKHTTASVVVRPALVQVPQADERERAIHGVPSLYQ